MPMRARENPFRAECVLSLPYRLAGTTWEALLDRLEALHLRAAIVGPEGSGKTTLQEELELRLRERGASTRWLRLCRENRPDAARLTRQLFDAARPGDVLFVDGAEQLSAWAWRRFARRAGGQRGLIITTHRAGRLPTLIECGTSPELLQALVDELLLESDASARGDLTELFHRHRGNLRSCLRELYDWHGIERLERFSLRCGEPPDSSRRDQPAGSLRVGERL
jgi:hypothetical protein